MSAEPEPLVTQEEPQNALTGKFTEAEWDALKKLRVRTILHPLPSST